MSAIRRPLIPLTDEQRILAERHWPLAILIAGPFARTYRRIGLDFIGEAGHALCLAACDWRSDGRSEFPTYARHKIKGACLDVLRAANPAGFRKARRDAPKIASLGIPPSLGGPREPAAEELPVGWEVESEDTVERWLRRLTLKQAAIMRRTYLYADGCGRDDTGRVAEIARVCKSRVWQTREEAIIRLRREAARVGTRAE